MARRRDYIPKDELIAAALRQAFDIPYEHARAMTAEQIISLFHVDHGIFKTWEENPGEFDKHWNLTFRQIRSHREKTKQDIKIIAKGRRITKVNEEFRARILAKTFGGPMPEPSRPKKKIPSRPFQKCKRKLRGRSSFQRMRSGQSLSAK